MFQFTHLSYPDRNALADALYNYEVASPDQRIEATRRLVRVANCILGSDEITTELLGLPNSTHSAAASLASEAAGEAGPLPLREASPARHFSTRGEL